MTIAGELLHEVAATQRIKLGVHRDRKGTVHMLGKIMAVMGLMT
jgi:hypothetical protein